MPVDNTVQVIDLKPLSYNPFLDGTVIDADVGGVLAPRNTAGSIDGLNSALTDPRPSNASTQSLFDSARRSSTRPPSFDTRALRGYRTNGAFFDTDAFERAAGNLSDTELDNLIDDLTSPSAGRAAQQAATNSRAIAQQALRRGSQFAGALGLAADAYNIGDAIIDPTNNPLDEIGDAAGSMIGGALGSKLGPVGALGGSLVGGWLGRQLGNLLQGGAAGEIEMQGPPDFEGGQCAGVPYNIRYVTDNRPNGQTIRRTGPIGFLVEDFENAGGTTGRRYVITHATGRTNLRSTTNIESSDISASIVDVTPADGSADTCGDPAGRPVNVPNPTTYAPTYPDRPPIYQPSPDGLPSPDPRPNPLPDTPTAPNKNPQPSPNTNPNSPDNPGGGSDLDNPPSPDNLPDPRPQPDRPGPNPNPEPDDKCCPESITKLDEIIELLTYQYQGEIDMAECGGESAPLSWASPGIDGVIEALKTVQEQIKIVHDNTKCGPDAPPLPMLWEVKSGQVPQLAIAWVRTAGGTSKWSMHVPHPRADINPDVPLSFPDYVKGPLMATLKLNDNSKVIVNARDKTEADKIMGYLTTNIIKGSYLTDSKLTYTEGAASRVISEVKAVHISAYGSDKGAPPLWAKSLD